MFRHWLRFLVTGTAVFFVPHLVSGVHVKSAWTALWVALVLGLLNAVLRPVLILLTLPITFLSLGVFILFINAFLFQLCASVVPGFYVDSFGAALLAALFVSFFSWLVTSFFSGARFQMHVLRPPRRDPREPRDERTIDLEEDESGHWK